MTLRKIISTALTGTMFYFTPSIIPSLMPASAITIPCGQFPTTWLPSDIAFAKFVPTPCPIEHAHTPAWPWVVIGCAGSIVVSALAANFWSHRELTTPEAWTCGLLYWVPQQFPPEPTNKHH